ncbi:hypothetical protein [Nonomuraea dietziae]|uniref:hypothetical protein n=1 Tax=Nonomuraea dietziae TaxID=65515 RepID=UPI0033E8E083
MTRPTCPTCGGVLPGDGPDELVCQCGAQWHPSQTKPSVQQTPPTQEKKTMLSERDAQIIALYAEDILVKDIADKFGLTAARISQIARAAQVPLRRPENAVKGVNVDAVIASYSHGLTVAEIAARHGVTDSTIRHHLKNAGWRNRRRRSSQPLAA